MMLKRAIDGCENGCHRLQAGQESQCKYHSVPVKFYHLPPIVLLHIRVRCGDGNL